MDEQVTNAKRHEPFNDERWPLAQAAAWVIWRSKERIAQLLSDITESEGRIQVFDIFNESARRENDRGGPPEGGVLPFVEAQAQLWERLKQGRLVAMGVKVGEATWSHLPASEWFNLDCFPCTDARSNSIGSNHSAVYDEITVARSAVLEIWPDITKVEARTKRGRKAKIGPDEIRAAVFRVLEDRGDIRDDLPKWRTQKNLIDATRALLESRKFEPKEIPGKTQLQMYVRKLHQEWQEKQ